MPKPIDPAPGTRYRHILIRVETYAAYGRRIVEGILDFAERERCWEFEFTRRAGLPKEVPEHIAGVIAEIRTEEDFARAAAMDIPVIAITGVYRPGPVPTVIADNEAVGRLAGEYLTNLGFAELAYFASSQLYYVSRRLAGFENLAEKVGARVHHYSPAPGEPWRLEEWLLGLPSPVGVLAAEDWSAVTVVNVCRDLGIAVPEQVAVLGVDDDEHLCRMASPPLSSIDHGACQIGFEAASLLDRMLAGEEAPVDPILVQPRKVVVRQSTDTLAIADPSVARAVEFIRTRACEEDIDVPAVVRHARASRRTLEAAFRRMLGRTILQEISRVRVERAKDLLVNTDLAMPEICERSGFSYPSRLSYVIKRETGLTPVEYRHESRA
ncbi:MAG: substrate-binding domain-containing protein [Planctomycetota bacterium]